MKCYVCNKESDGDLYPIDNKELCSCCFKLCSDTMNYALVAKRFYELGKSEKREATNGTK